MSTRSERERPAASADRTAPGSGRADALQLLALVASAERELLLRAHRWLLRREDLEDCYSQATLELLCHVRRGGVFANRAHAANALELRFVSRVRDRRRALGGRSPMQAALEGALSLAAVAPGEITIVDRRAETETLVVLRERLRSIERLARELSPDQRLVLACELALQMRCAEFCRRFGWTPEKYRKVSQRARSRLRALVELDDRPVRHSAHRSERGQGLSYDHVSPHS